MTIHLIIYMKIVSKMLAFNFLEKVSHDQLGFIQEKQIWLNMRKKSSISFSTIMHKRRKSHILISIVTEKAFYKFQYLFNHEKLSEN